MSSLYHDFGSDIALLAGSIRVAAGSDEVRQRLLRRLCTNPGDYIWQPDFGAGLPRMIGGPLDVDRVRGLVLTQVVQDPGVDDLSPVDVAVEMRPGGRYDCTIAYTDAQTGVSQTLNFSS